MVSHGSVAKKKTGTARPVPRLRRTHKQRSVPRVRRTQEQRTEAMRARLIKAAIDCLYRTGCSQTTTAMVATAAGASRGAMLHHFPTKEDLFQAVVEHAFERQINHYDQRLKAIDDPVERFLSLPVVAWESFHAPIYLAWLEIWMATRSHPQLRVRFRRTHEAMEARFVETIQRVAREAGARDATRVNTVRVILRAALHGLATEVAINHNAAQFAPVLDEMRRIFADVLAAR